MRSRLILNGGIDKVRNLIKEGKRCKEISSIMGYSGYDSFKEALQTHDTNFTTIYKETMGKEYVRRMPLMPAHVIKKYVDCGVSVASIQELFGVSYDAVSRSFKKEYCKTIRQYKKDTNGI